ncbi:MULTISPECIES: sensor histidine kinase [Streptomyces]|uniref:sensor histidine kinase n=1 Tax=Streptomyces TaxID=1883 RepID=UPI00073DE1F1|nr:histidine kinase [Streptomyces sp. EAS-AB2608]MYU26491.1 sensor histidine kinase [Streptomyces sp. SID7810]BCM71056.1 putative two-component system sensor kinase [Streptomyces sp. EAS-AB2608]CUW25301.1 Sensor histidine kinase YehU [Streptomyces reticuli]
MNGLVVLAAAAPPLFAAGLAVGRLLARRTARGDTGHGTPVERATFHTLHTASLAAPPLRAGLTEDAARKAVRRLRPLFGTAALGLTAEDRPLAWDGPGRHHEDAVLDRVRHVLDTGRTQTFTVACADPDCPVRRGAVAPLTVDQRVLGTLVVLGAGGSASAVRATEEVARWVSVQLELAELDRTRTGLIEAEIRALRAQISPHFIYNSLAAIASFVRTDPERARDLLLEFADFTRYSFRRHGEFTTLAEELRSIEQFLELVRARFGQRLQVTLQIAPEVLPVAVPFLCLQPLVENAVKHGLEESVERSRIGITAQDEGATARIVIEDNGIGMEPDRLRRLLRGEGGPATGIGLRNVDERLRQVYGDDHGLVIETGVGAGMKITIRIPKYRPGVHSTPRHPGTGGG